MSAPIQTVGREAVQVMTPNPSSLAGAAWSFLLIDPD
jgi:ABC-type sulfate transport system substrate-binding protein